MARIDQDKLNNAFALMRKAGLVARQRFSCCGGCAGGDLANFIGAKSPEARAKVVGCCFYTRQGNPASGALYLTYGPVDVAGVGKVGRPTEEVGQIVIGALTQAGLRTEWDGSKNTTIKVLA